MDDNKKEDLIYCKRCLQLEVIRELELSEDIKEAEKETNDIIDSFNSGKLEIIPGKTSEETREIKILQALNGIRTKIGKIVGKEVHSSNPISVMMNSGAGGNVLNITQMACCVGQQALWGKRINIGYTNRTLSFFKEGDRVSLVIFCTSLIIGNKNQPNAKANV